MVGIAVPTTVASRAARKVAASHAAHDRDRRHAPERSLLLLQRLPFDRRFPRPVHAVTVVSD